MKYRRGLCICGRITEKERERERERERGRIIPGGIVKSGNCFAIDRPSCRKRLLVVQLDLC